MPKILAELDLFKGEVALVTGSASNIGKGIAAGLAAEGAHILLADVDPDRNADTAKLIRDNGGSCEELTVDLSRPDGWKTLLPAIDTQRPSLFVHSACPARHEKDRPREVNEETLDAMLNVNVRSGFLIARELGRRMVDHAVSGRMLFITSLHAGTPRNLPHYSASKAAMTLVMQELARDLAPHSIRVNAIALGALPGGGNTNITEEFAGTIPMRRVGVASDMVGPAVALLSNDLFGYVTGVTLPVDGGLALFNWIPYADPA